VDGERLNAIGYLSKNQYIYSCLDIAAVIGGYTNVPLYDSFGSEALM